MKLSRQVAKLEVKVYFLFILCLIIKIAYEMNTYVKILNKLFFPDNYLLNFYVPHYTLIYNSLFFQKKKLKCYINVKIGDLQSH